MKTIVLCLALISVAVAQRPAPQKAQQPALQRDRQVLFDFRTEDEVTPAKITPATQRMVLSKVFRKYLTDQNRCNFPADAGEDYLAAARKAGKLQRRSEEHTFKLQSLAF